MADIKYYDVILKPVITEKSMNAMGDRKYTFMVHVDANKSMIKEAVEKMFPGTKVAGVNTMNCEGKTKRRGMTFGKTAASKKAIVKLTEDSKEIEISRGCDYLVRFLNLVRTPFPRLSEVFSGLVERNPLRLRTP